MRLRKWLLIAMVTLSACGQTLTVEDLRARPPEGTPPIPVIVDYSPTVSDAGALMFLLSHSRFDVLAVSMSETGEAGCELGVRVTLGILAMFDREDIPVACDPEVPGHANEWPAAFLVGHEALLDGLPESAAEARDELPSDLIARVAAESPIPVVLYAVAPQTVVARALSDHPSLAGDIERIVIMGGAVDAPGNVLDSGAEWNLYIDSRAAAAVIGSGVAVTLVPLDATNDVPVPANWAAMISEQPQSEAIVYLRGLVDKFPSVSSGFYFLWDELAVSVAAGELFADFQEMPITVVVGGPQDGRTTRADGEPITVATGVDQPELFYMHFLSTLAGGD